MSSAFSVMENYAVSSIVSCSSGAPLSPAMLPSTGPSTAALPRMYRAVPFVPWDTAATVSHGVLEDAQV